MPRPVKDRRGFTLAELLVVVGIIVLLTAIVVPNIVRHMDVAKMETAVNQIAQFETALAAYYADFGAYPGDVFPTEDKNNDGILDAAEDTGVDIDGDGIYDYACNTDGTANADGRLEHGDGVINIDDLEWALKTTAKNGPYLKEVPLDPWDNKYVYYAPMTRPTFNVNDTTPDRGNQDYLYIDPADDDTPATGTLPARTLCTEDTNGNGKLDIDLGEDNGIASYDTIAATEVRTVTTPGGVLPFPSMRAGWNNGILDHGDDDNKNSNIETRLSATYPYVASDPQKEYELGNADISPDGLARNLGYYIYSIGRNKKDETAMGYEDINLNGIVNDGSDATHPFIVTDDTATFTEDIDNDNSLDTGYEDTGLDGLPGTKDTGEDNWPEVETPDVGSETPPRDEDFTGTYNTDTELDLGGDDINNWNKKAPWRSHTNYGG